MRLPGAAAVLVALLSCFAIIAISYYRPAGALENGVGQLPAMGWSSWNAFRCDISENTIKEVADAVVGSGLRDAGYRYINIDDCWMSGRDPATGAIIASHDKFPGGMKALGDYLHSRGLLFGIYSSAGDMTCEGLPGSYGYEEVDARSYAEWGVDYLKYDYCGMEKHPEGPKAVYSRMRDALKAASEASGRPILFSLCNWGGGAPNRWGAAVGNSWRTGRDLFAVWDRQGARELGLPGYLQSVMEAVDGQKLMWRHAGPGGFNDPDMLVVGIEGMFPYGIVDSCPPAVPDCTPGEYITRERWGMVGGLTAAEQRAHFSLWVVMASPLLLGNDPRHMSEDTVSLLTAREVIAISQDPLGAQGKVTAVDKAPGGGATEVWSKPLAADGAFALLLLNRGTQPADISISWKRDCPETKPEGGGGCSTEGEPEGCEGWASSGECERNPGFMLQSCSCSCTRAAANNAGDPASSEGDLPDRRPRLVRDLWESRDLRGPFEPSLSFTVEPHGATLLMVQLEEPSEAAQVEADDRGLEHAAAAAALGSLRYGSEGPAEDEAQALTDWMDGLGPRFDGGGGGASSGGTRVASCGPWGMALAVENVVLLAAGLCLFLHWRRRRRGVVMGRKLHSLKL